MPDAYEFGQGALLMYARTKREESIDLESVRHIMLSKCFSINRVEVVGVEKPVGRILKYI